MSAAGSNIGDFTINYTGDSLSFTTVFVATGGLGSVSDEEIWDIAERLKDSDYVTRAVAAPIVIAGVAKVGADTIPEPTP